MQNVGQQFGQGGVTSHQGAISYGHTESSQPNGGSITSSLRQFRKKDAEKQQASEIGATVAESHVARVAPHNHYPPRPQDCYRYPSQFPDYSLPPQVKYSEISDQPPFQDPISPSVIQKAKGKEYMEMCNAAQPHLKQSYPDHLANQQPYAAEPNLHQYLQKDPQVHASYKPESQYYPKEPPQYQQLPHQMQKYNMTPQMRKYPSENDFLSKLRRIHPTMARSIMSDHHLQESQSSYQTMDQNRMYPHQNQRYMNYATPVQNNPYAHGYMPPQYSNYPSSCSYTRPPPPQMPPRFPSTNPHERSLSPRRGYAENLPIPPINYTAIPQRISPNYAQYNPPEYAQHYQHRRGPVTPQEYYQSCRPPQYMPHQMAQPEMSENRVTVSDSIKQYIENWADEETASEMNQIESGRLVKENLRPRDDQSTETVYMINASELQYLENGIPLVASENGIPLVTSENGQYFLKSGVTIDDSTGMVRIVEKSNQVEPGDGATDRVVNLHIVDPEKPDCMLASKPSDPNQRQNENLCNIREKPRVVVHQNTVIQPNQLGVDKTAELSIENQPYQTKVGSSLPILEEGDVTSDENPLEKFDDDVFKECKKQTVDKNCSPINMEQIEEEFNENTSEICPLKLLGQTEEEKDGNTTDALKNMPIIDLLPDTLQCTPIENQSEDQTIEEDIRTSDSIIENYDEDNERFDELLEECVDKNKDAERNCIKNEENTYMGTCSIQNVKSENTLEDTVVERASIISNCSKNKDEDIHETNDDVKNVLEGRNEIGRVKKEINEEKTDAKEENNSANAIEEDSKEVISEDKTEPLITPNASEFSSSKDDEEKTVTTRYCRATEESNSPVFVGASTKEDIKLDDTTVNCSSEGKTHEPIIRRSRRIFSVDDIMNNIGNNPNPSKLHAQLTERRRSLQITREFLEKEIDTSFLFIKKPRETVETFSEDGEKNGKESEEDAIETSEEELDRKHQMPFVESFVSEDPAEDKQDVVGEEADKKTDEKPRIEEKSSSIKEIGTANVTEKEDEEVEENQTTDHNETARDEPICETSEICEANALCETGDQLALLTEEGEEIAREDISRSKDSTSVEEDDCGTEKLNSASVCEKDVIMGVENICDTNARENSKITTADIEEEIITDRIESCSNTSEGAQSDSNQKAVAPSEVQYRNAIRIDDNNVLLEIAGELVEISVNMINGKKVITVLPLSETTVVDFNDNYESLDTTQIQEPIKMDAVEEESNVEVSQILAPVEEPEPDVIESTSEIIIGMDISLEEEIKLDLEKPQNFCTKAAKKSYENDLQIPSITTSEDVTDNNNVNSYSPNDKVSSSKEQDTEKSNSDRERCNKSVHSSKKSSGLYKKVRRMESKEKSASRELMKARNEKKEVKDQTEEEEDFVPFKDLIKARKLKKKKLQQEKAEESVSADSTNRLDQEPENDSSQKPEQCEGHDGKNCDGDSQQTSIAEESVKGSSNEDTSHQSELNLKPNIVHEENKKSRCNQIDKVGMEKSGATENSSAKILKKVTFGSVTYRESKIENDHSAKKGFKLEDPRLKPRPNVGILVPSVSELLRENEGLPSNKKKLSLAEYNSRKRKLVTSNQEKEAKVKRSSDPTDDSSVEAKLEKKEPNEVPLNRFKIHRPKSLDDIKLFGRPTDSHVKRKFSLEITSSKPNHFDWEETQSPKTNTPSHEDAQKRLNEFRGLINNNKSKSILDVSVASTKSTPIVSSEDEILQNYKVQVDSKLSTLNLQIPRVVKAPPNVLGPFSNAETTFLMQRFLKNEKLSGEEMEKIKKIISYKRLMQQLDKIKTPGLSSSPLNPSYEIRRSCSEKEMKLHLKKVPEKKKKRFRNLYMESYDESDSELSDHKRDVADYSVVQSNTYAAGVPKLIIKRKTEMPVPVVKLQRLDLRVLTGKRRRLC